MPKVRPSQKLKDQRRTLALNENYRNYGALQQSAEIVAEREGLPINNNNAIMANWGGGGAAYVPPNTGSFSMAGNRDRPNTSLSIAAARGAGSAAGPYGPMNAFFGMSPAASSVAGLVGAAPATVAKAMENNSRVGNAALAAAAAASKPKAAARKLKAVAVAGPGGGGGAAPVVMGEVSPQTFNIFSQIEKAAQDGTRVLSGLYPSFIKYIQTVSQVDRIYLKEKLTEIALEKSKDEKSKDKKSKDVAALLMAMANYIRL